MKIKRASLVNKSANKKSKVIPDAADPDLDAFTKRLLMSMVFDISQLAKGIEQVKVEVFTMAKAHGIVPPEADE